MNPEEYYPIPPTKIQKAIICTPEEVQMWKDENLKLKTRITELEAQVAALREIAAEQKAAHIAFVGFHRNMNEDETKNKAQDEARRQLSEKHPEVFG